MQNLFALLKRYSSFLYFLLLQFICFFLLINYNNFHGSKYWNSTNDLVGWIQEKEADIKSYFSLKQENEKLSVENSRLKEVLFSGLDSRKRKWLQEIDSIKKWKYEYIPARVVSSTSKYRKNYLLLDIGWADGVDPNQLMGVVGPQGVVGYAKKGGSEHYTQVVSILHSKFLLSVVHSKSEQQGMLSWQNEDDRFTATISDFPAYVDIQVGDAIVTSGNTGVFPRGEVVGTVSEVVEIPKSNSAKLTIKLATDFNSVYHVSVIRNNEILELQDLETGTEDEPKTPTTE